MTVSRRILRHLAFWSVYFLVNLFNELYLNITFTRDPSTTMFLKAVASQCLTLMIKVPAVYLFLYVLLPGWFRPGNKWKTVLLGLGALLLMTVLLRVVMQHLIWTSIYWQQRPDMTLMQQLARGFYSMLDLLQVIGIALSIKLVGMRFQHLRREKELAREKLESEMKHLRSQLNPHFLFNSLNSIYALARNRSDATPETVMRLSSILRYVIYETRKGQVTLGQELEVARAYIDLQKMRFGERVELELETEVDDLRQPVIPLILLPLLENVFKHGVEDQPGQVRCTCRVRLSEGKLTVTTRNPAREVPQAPAGIGLSNLRRQLELQFHDQSLDAGQKGDHFVVKLYLDLNSHAGTEMFDRRG